MKYISEEEFVKYKRYYKRMIELHPEEYALEESKPTPEQPKKHYPRKTNAKQRADAIERDKGVCQDCGAAGSSEVHHITHRAKGGSDELENLITLCPTCHAKRHKGEPIYNLMVSRLRGNTQRSA